MTEDQSTKRDAQIALLINQAVLNGKEGRWYVMRWVIAPIVIALFTAGCMIGAAIVAAGYLAKAGG